MTISQSSSNCTSDAALTASIGRPPALTRLAAAIRRLAGWREKRRAAAELARLAAIGDYLLKDIGLDPGLARHSPAAALDHLLRRR